MPAATTITPPMIRSTTGALPEPPPDDPSSELTGATAFVSVLSPCLSLSLLAFSPVGALSAGVVAAVVVPGVVDEPLLPPSFADLLPVAEGTLGRYSWPEGAANAGAVLTAAAAATRQSAAAVLQMVVKRGGGRRY